MIETKQTIETYTSQIEQLTKQVKTTEESNITLKSGLKEIQNTITSNSTQFQTNINDIQEQKQRTDKISETIKDMSTSFNEFGKKCNELEKHKLIFKTNNTNYSFKYINYLQFLIYYQNKTYSIHQKKQLLCYDFNQLQN